MKKIRSNETNKLGSDSVEDSDDETAKTEQIFQINDPIIKHTVENEEEKVRRPREFGQSLQEQTSSRVSGMDILLTEDDNDSSERAKVSKYTAVHAISLAHALQSHVLQTKTKTQAFS